MEISEERTKKFQAQVLCQPFEYDDMNKGRCFGYLFKTKEDMGGVHLLGWEVDFDPVGEDPRDSAVTKLIKRYSSGIPLWASGCFDEGRLR